MDTDQTRLEAWIRVGRLAGMCAVVGAGTCYVLGLLIVNMRLAAFGVVSNNFVRTEYMLVGALYIFLLALVRAWMSLSKHFWRRGIEAIRKRHRSAATLWIVALILCAPALLAYPIMFVSSFNMMIWNWMSLGLIGMLVMGNYGITEVMNGLANIAEKANADSRHEKTGIIGMLDVVDVAWPVLLFLGVLSGYAYLGYANMNPALGGGNRGRVILSPTAEGRELCRELSLKFTRDSTGVGPVKILTESEDEIVILMDEKTGETCNMRAIRLNRSLFKAVITLKLDANKYWGFREADSLRIQ